MPSLAGAASRYASRGIRLSPFDHPRLRARDDRLKSQNTAAPRGKGGTGGSRPAEKILGPALIIVAAGDLPHQLGRGDVFEVAWCDTFAQRLQGIVDRLHRG